MTSKLSYWIPVLLLAIVIFYLSSRQSIQTSEFFWHDFVIKKTAHFIEYATFSIFIYRALKNTSNLSHANIIKFTLLLTILYAMSDEIHQTFVPSRTGKVRDVIIDAAGASTAIFLLTQKLQSAPRWIKELAKHFELIS